jgi:hypothetical protein
MIGLPDGGTAAVSAILGIVAVAFAIWYVWQITRDDDWTNQRGGF